MADGIERFSVGEYLRDELEARGWSTWECARRMGGDFAVDVLTLDLHIAVIGAPTEEQCRLSPVTAEGLSRAFGTSAEMWLNLDRAFHGEGE